jgi:nicotinamidase/pyrazinamidase
VIEPVKWPRRHRDISTVEGYAPIMPDTSTVLIVVDVQNSFLPDGSLAVPKGHEVVPVINDLAKRFANVVLTQDWHPAGHRSFASSHPGKKPFDKITLDYGEQILWPDHCVQGTEGARLSRDLDVARAQLAPAHSQVKIPVVG